MTAPNARRQRTRRARAHARQQARQEAVEHVNGNIGPTRQTVERLTPDPIWRLVRRKTITRTQHDAALDIRKAFKLLTRGIGVKSAALDRVDNGGNVINDTDECVGLQIRYTHWRREMISRGWSAGNVFDIVVEGLSLADAARLHKRDWRKEKRYFLKALTLFCQVSGWVPQKRLVKLSRQE